jgi:hypothetical protein
MKTLKGPITFASIQFKLEGEVGTALTIEFLRSDPQTARGRTSKCEGWSWSRQRKGAMVLETFAPLLIEQKETPQPEPKEAPLPLGVIELEQAIAETGSTDETSTATRWCHACHGENRSERRDLTPA